MPTPRPDRSVVTATVEKPGANSSSAAPAASSAAAASASSRPRSRPRADGGRVDPAAVVAHRHDDVAAGVARGQLEHAGRRLAGGDALLRRLEAVVQGVAHEVHERVAERVDDRAVELGAGAVEPQLDLLAEARREVAHEPREAQEDGLDRHHPHACDGLLERLRGAREALDRRREAGHVGVRGERLDGRAVLDQLAHQVQQLVEPLGVHTHRGRLGTRTGARALAGASWIAVVLRTSGRRLGSGDGAVRGLRLGGHPHGGQLADRARAVGERLLVGARGHPRLDAPAGEALDRLRRRHGADQLAVQAQRVEQHEGAHRRHLAGVVELGDDAQQPLAGRQLAGQVGQRGVAVARQLLLRGALARERAQPLHERRRVEQLAVAGTDRRDRRLDRVEARREHVDRLARQAAGALAQQVEHVLHRMGERDERVEAHRRAHALERVRDAEDPVGRVAIVRRRLDAHEQQPELLHVLARLREEGGAVGVRAGPIARMLALVDHAATSAAIAPASSPSGSFACARRASATARGIP